MEKKLCAGIVGCTGMVGQRFILLLADHPMFEITALAASKRSAGKTYAESVAGRWKMDATIPEQIGGMPVYDALEVGTVAKKCDVIFCAVDMDKQATRDLEDAYAKAECAVISNNSAHRHTQDVPMVIPEINPDHFVLIETQRKRFGTERGFVAVKPNCSIQSYVPMIFPLLKYKPQHVVVSTYQAISGAGKTFADWPEMADNVIPYIGGEEEKSEREPLRIFGKIDGGRVTDANAPLITTQCVRVPVTDGHLASVFVTFEDKPSKDEIIKAWESFKGLPQEYKLPSAPERFITYFSEDDRPQTNPDRDLYGGMGVAAGRLREDAYFDYKFIGLSHNTVRGAAGGALLTAELLAKTGWIKGK